MATEDDKNSQTEQTEQTTEGLSKEAIEATNSAKTLSEDAQESKTTQKEIDKKLDQQKKVNDANAKLDEANQKLSDLPKKIEEDIDEMKKKLDLLLGKAETEETNPDSPNFDVDKLIGEFKKNLNPVVSSTAPLTPVSGSIPVIGEAGGMVDKMSTASKPASSLTKEQIKEKVPTPPEIPPGMMDKILDIGDNILTLCATLPMMMINVIWSMIKVIYSKLKIITSVIPLGSMYPLNLLSQAQEATPKMITFMETAPSQVKNIAKGVVKEKMAESMALAQPTPQYVDNSISATTQEIKENSTTDAYKPTEPSEQQPEEPPVVAEIPPVQPIPEPAPPPLTWDDLYEKWPKKFSRDGWYVEEDTIKGIIDNYKEFSNGEELIKYRTCERSENGVIVDISITDEHEGIIPDTVDDELNDIWTDFRDEPNISIYYHKFKSYEDIQNADLGQSAKTVFQRLNKSYSFKVGLYEYKPLSKRKKKSDDDDE